MNIVGNSFGGYVGAYFAATNPELVKGMALLNATPFWAFMPNARRHPQLSQACSIGRTFAGSHPCQSYHKSLVSPVTCFFGFPRFFLQIVMDFSEWFSGDIQPESSVSLSRFSQCKGKIENPTLGDFEDFPKLAIFTG